jgi:hypothetical protein
MSDAQRPIDPPQEYESVLASIPANASHRDTLDALCSLTLDTYAQQVPNAALLEFEQGDATYWFDPGTPNRSARTVLSVSRSARPDVPRDSAYQRGFPSRAAWNGRPLDRGHFIPHSGGGLFGPNLFDQDRALNRGWSNAGRRYRAVESRFVASNNSFFLARPVYVDASDFAGFIDAGVIDSQRVHVERFRNRFDLPPEPGETRLGMELDGATDAQIGALGEETAVVIIETQLSGEIVAIGEAGLPRAAGRQDLDVLAIIDGELIAFEVKSRFRSALAGRLTRQGNLRRPRLRRDSATQHSQGSQAYVAERLADLLEIDDDFGGIETRVMAVDLVSMRAQQFAVSDDGRRMAPLASPNDCEEAADMALSRVLDHRGYL